MPDTPPNEQPPVNPEGDTDPRTPGTRPTSAPTPPPQPAVARPPAPSTGSTPVYRAPPPQPRRGGCGCWLTLLVTVFLAGLLVVAGLFLPPVSLYDRLFGRQYVMLDATANAVAEAGMTLIVDPDDTGVDFGVLLGSVGIQDFVSAPASAAANDDMNWIAPVRAAIPPYLALSSPVYTLENTGTPPASLSLTFDLPPGADRVDLYGFSGGAWTFIPAQPTVDGRLFTRISDLPDYLALFSAEALDPIIHTTIEIRQMMNAGVSTVATIVSPAGLTPDLQGRLVGSLAPGFELNAGYRVMPIIRNFDDPRAIDAATVPAILNNDNVREAHIQQIAAIAANGGYSGVFIDYRDLPAEQSELFVRFLRDLKARLRASNLLLGVVVPAAENRDGAWHTGAYDWRGIGRHADYVLIDLSPNPLDYAVGEDRLVEAMLRWGTGEIDRYKILAGMTALSLREVSGDFTPVRYSDALAELGNVRINAETSETNTVAPGTPITASLDGASAVPGLDTTVQASFIDYIGAGGNVASRVWLTTASALRWRLDRVAEFAVGGVSVHDLAGNGLAEGILETLLDYKLQRPSPPRDTELALRWRIEDASGMIDEIITGLNEPQIVVTLDAIEGNIAINVEVIDGERPATVRGGAAVSVFAPTPTPTPIPTATPTPQPTVTPTLEVIVPTQPAVVMQNVAPANNPAPVNPGPGRIAPGFEYGGHVTSTSSDAAANAMRRAGMTWMKVQVRYAPGNDPGGVASIINEARARGFKVLLGVVGNPADLATGGGSYIQEFANYLGGVAALGPDAIEVWNEPNIDREWPRGQISGANYTAMLAAAYNAIKSRNPNVMVISAAPAPTGAEAAFPGQVVNDDRFLSQMAAAGAVNYMDCVGVHYNEGVVSPSQTSGDPRDNFYSRYYLTMENLYWNAFNGQRPLCFTELGYVTPEGYGPLPPFFSWGQNNTVAQQAAWLAEAISIASRSGRVRMVIVWNVDFTRYDANDPQAGYAMIRPGGGCPACDAIAGAR